MTHLPTTIAFGNTQLSILDHQGRPWLSAADVAQALGYKRSDSVSRIYERNKDEFTDEMSETVKLTVSAENKGLQKEVRIFSPRGCHLIAMFAKTQKAKAFRQWVLDVLDVIQAQATPINEPTLNEEDYNRLASKVWSISRLFRKQNTVSWNIWERLRFDMGVNPIRNLPRRRVPEAEELLNRISEQANHVHNKMMDIEQRFAREVLRNDTPLEQIFYEFEQLIQQIEAEYGIRK